MAVLGEVLQSPLGQLLQGVDEEVFDRKPELVKLRDLHREMSKTLSRLRQDGQYCVLTNRGAPAFLLIPIDPNAWAALLVAAAEPASTRD